MGLDMSAVNSLPVDPSRLEVLDLKNRPIAVFPEKTVHEQKLRHQRAAALIYTAEGKLLLSRRPSSSLDGPLCWDVSLSAHIFAGQSGYETLRQGLFGQLGITVSKMRFVHCLEPAPETEQELVPVFTCIMRSEDPGDENLRTMEYMLGKPHEVGYVIRHFPGRVTSTLRVLFETGVLFEA